MVIQRAPDYTVTPGSGTMIKRYAAVLAAGALISGFGVWLHAHDRQIRQEAELAQTMATVEELRGHLDSAYTVLAETEERAREAEAKADSTIRNARTRVVYRQQDVEGILSVVRQEWDSSHVAVVDSLSAQYEAIIDAKDEEISILYGRIAVFEHRIGARDEIIARQEAILEAERAVVAELNKRANPGFFKKLQQSAPYMVASAAAAVVVWEYVRE